MGTRHLTVVQLDGEYMIAQYGQWDGYPSGQGEIVLEFLNNWNRSVFEEKLRASRWLTKEEGRAIEDTIKNQELENIWEILWPQLLRDTGAKILKLVQESEPGIVLKNSIDFAADSLFCEWAYVIDLDLNLLEVYKGFNEEPLDPSERFFGATTEDPHTNTEKYYPIRKVTSYSLHTLPSLEQFIEECDPDEDETA